MAVKRIDRIEELEGYFRTFISAMYEGDLKQGELKISDIKFFREMLEISASKLRPYTPFDVRIYAKYKTATGEEKELRLGFIDEVIQKGFMIPDDARSVDVYARMVAQREKGGKFKVQSGDEPLFYDTLLLCRSQAGVEKAREKYANRQSLVPVTVSQLETNSKIINIVPSAAIEL